MYKKHQKKLTEINDKYQQDRLAAAKSYAENLTNLYQTEAQKLLNMQDDLNQKLKDREQKTADARTQVAEYVTRQKLSESDRQAYDQDRKSVV